MCSNIKNRIGLTGGIGSGKSMVAKVMQLMGVPVYDTDWHAKDLQVHDEELKDKIKELLGKESYLPNGELNKPYIANKIFNNKELLESVNQLVHPAVWNDFEKWEQEQNSLGYKLVGIESAILYEAKLNEKVETVWVVDAPLETRIERACKRDNKPRELIEARIRNQKTALHEGDIVISNDGKNSVIEQIAKQLENQKSGL